MFDTKLAFDVVLGLVAVRPRLVYLYLVCTAS